MATEKRLIDANELVDTIYKSDESLHSTQWETDEIVDQIDRIPTVDAVEVIRCKDCKHTRKKTGHEQFMYNENVCICTKEDIWGINKNEPVWDDWFCSCGERRTDETD